MNLLVPHQYGICMLIQFKVKNFRSIRDEAILDLSATKESKNSDQIVTVGKEKILPVAAIYGANASGKSNVYKALHFMSQYVIESFKYGDDDRDYQMTRPAPFLFDKRTADQPSTFELHFTVPGDESEKIYNYGFSIGKSGIEEEWLFTKSRMPANISRLFTETMKDLNCEGLQKRSGPAWKRR